MKVKSVLTAALSAVLTATPALSTQDPVFNAHLRLWKAIQSVGVATLINDKRLCRGDNAGSYYSGARTLVICQENGYPGGPEVPWTAGDYDTLRHEAHHIVQDCVAGRISDNSLSPMFDRETWTSFVKEGLSEAKIDWIIEQYQKNNASPHVITMELEAFAVANSISPSSIARKVGQYCL